MDKEQWNDRYLATEMVWSVDANHFLKKEIEDEKPGRALDLGAGEGRNSIWLARLGWQVDAVDFSSVGLKKAKKRAERSGLELNLIKADLGEYEPQVQAYDLVALAYIHLPKEVMSEVLNKAAAAVKPGGLFFLIGHDRENLENGFGGPQDPDIHYNADDISVALDDFGIEKAHQVSRKVEKDGVTHTAIDVLVRARRL